MFDEFLCLFVSLPDFFGLIHVFHDYGLLSVYAH